MLMLQRVLAMEENLALMEKLEFQLANCMQEVLWGGGEDIGVGIVLGFSVFFGKLNYGLIAMIGALSFLYIPNTPLYHRMAVVMCCSFGIVSSFFLGILTHFLPSVFAFIPITCGHGKFYFN